MFIKPMTFGTQPGKALLYDLKIDIISHSARVNLKGPSTASLALILHIDDITSPSLSYKH